MNRPNIAVLDAATFGDDLDLSPLASIGNLTVHQLSPPDTLPERLAGADIAVLNKVKLGPRELAGASRLRLICVFATGFDNIDVGYCRSRGIAVCNVVGYSTSGVAQLTAATALSLVCRLREYTRYTADGTYSAGGSANILKPVFHELDGMTWGIAGYGNIGRRVGSIASALGCRVIAWRRNPTPEETASGLCVGIDELCRESDIISVHLPLNDGTRGLFSRERIAMMKPGAVFINVARGAVADEQALADAVLSGHLGGLGADVYSTEPFRENHPFFAIRDLDNVILTPHMAWGAYESRLRCLDEVVLNINAFLSGERRSRVD